MISAIGSLFRRILGKKNAQSEAHHDDTRGTWVLLFQPHDHPNKHEFRILGYYKGTRADALDACQAAAGELALELDDVACGTYDVELASDVE